MVEVSTVIDGEKYVLVPDGGDKTCDKCALVGKLGVCQMKNEPFVEFNGIKPCRPLKGVWKKEADIGR